MSNHRSWRHILLLGGLGLLAAGTSHAQTAAADSTTLAATVAQLHTGYLASQKMNAALYNGVEYVPYLPPNTTGHPFLDTREAQPGSVLYDGYLYPDLSLLYDIQQDGLVLANLGSPLRIRLVGEHVGYFIMAGRKFVWLQPPADAQMPTGYYELLFDDSRAPVQLLGRYGKKVERKGGAELKQEFRQKDQFFLRTAQGFFPVSSASDVTAAWPEKKKELKDFVRANKLKFTKEQRAASLAALVGYYDKLVQASPAR